MKRFFKNILFFCITFVVFNALVVLLLFMIKNSHHFKHPEFNNAFKNLNIEVIALGNSKLECALDSKTLSDNLQLKSSVLGLGSANISTSKLTMETYLNKCRVKPKLVIMEVSWFSFSTKRTNLHRITGDFFMNDIKLWRYFYKYYPDITRNIQLYMIENIKNKRVINVKEVKTSKKESVYNQKAYTFDLKKFEEIFPDYKAGIDKLLLHDFYLIVEMCKKNNITLVLFSAPEDEEYSRNQEDVEQVKSVFKQVSSINDNIIYLDYTLGGDFYDKKYEMWLDDSHHIREKELFTQVLTSDIKMKMKYD